MAIVVWIRFDFLGVLLTLWILIFVFFKRSIVKIIWPLFVLYLAIMFPIQYLMAIGLPVDWCIGNILF